MEPTTIILGIISITLLILLFNYSKKLAALQNDLTAAREVNAEMREKCARLESRAITAEQQVARLKKTQVETAQSTLREQQKINEQSEMRFRLIAGELLSTHIDKMNARNETNINRILTPLKDDIDRFRRDVTDFYSKESAERFSLQQRIKELIQTNDSIGREARELSRALRGNSKVQGDWGELVLETILENSGLRKGEEFEVQMQRDEDGSIIRGERGNSLRPDVVVKYPGGKVMVIDSKVSLTSFVEMANCESDEERARLGQLHLSSVIRHVNELSQKNYQDYVGRHKLDFVMMFIPNESAYTAALGLDPSLWEKAYDKRVLIVSPTQLVASLKIVSQLWSHDRQTRNAIDIAERAGAMYDKFVGFVSDMEKIERSLSSTRTAYDAAMKKLRDGTGSLIVRAEKLRELGVKSSKRLPASSDDSTDV
ncbi:MAG: DNA recombination protein RmuC [Paramuribaculum sp.]|nr:DNA recombination protein RmuC [Paramuribaculum sp.]